MRISCNGCRVLRKGCSDDCSIRPCLEWIKAPESQGNATVFLAKFYGRAGLVNLINAGPEHLRPAIFTSLLYEACGRIVNPIYGTAGLLSSGNWQLCQRAVEAVLKGSPITPMATDAAEARKGPPMKAYDIRHVYKEDDLSGSSDPHRARKRCRSRRSGGRSKRNRTWVGSGEDSGREEANGSLISHESSLSHQSEAAKPNVGIEGCCRSEGRACREQPDQGSEPALDAAGEGQPRADDGEVDLDLTLGLKPVRRFEKPKMLAGAAPEAAAGIRKIELLLDTPVS